MISITLHWVVWAGIIIVLLIAALKIFFMESEWKEDKVNEKIDRAVGERIGGLLTLRARAEEALNRDIDKTVQEKVDEVTGEDFLDSVIKRIRDKQVK